MTSWADHFNTYDEYCAYAGIDSPASLQYESECIAQEGWIEAQDDMEARGGPVYRRTSWSQPDDIPF